MSCSFLPVRKSDRRIILTTFFGKKNMIRWCYQIFCLCPPLHFSDGLKPPTSPTIVPPDCTTRESGVDQLVAVQLRCTRAGTPDNSADIDYDHFPEEVTGRCAYCIQTFSVCFVLDQSLWFFVSRIQHWDPRKRFSWKIEAADFGGLCFFRWSYDCFLGPFCIDSHFRTPLTKRPSTLTMTGLSKRGSGRLCRGIREREMDFILLYTWYSWTYFDMSKSCPWRGNGNMPLSTGESLIVDRQTPTLVAMVNIIPQNHTVCYTS